MVLTKQPGNGHLEHKVIIKIQMEVMTNLIMVVMNFAIIVWFQMITHQLLITQEGNYY